MDEGWPPWATNDWYKVWEQPDLNLISLKLQTRHLPVNFLFFLASGCVSWLDWILQTYIWVKHQQISKDLKSRLDMQPFSLQCTWPFASFSTRQPDLQLITEGISCTCQVRKTASPSGPYNAVRSVEVQPAVELIEVVIYRRHWQAKSYREGCGSVTRPEVI